MDGNVGLHVLVYPRLVENCVPALWFGQVQCLQGPNSSTSLVIPMKSSIHVHEGASLEL